MVIKISAKIIRFPSICCSCCGENPKNWYSAIATRIVGKRVIRTTSKSWEFPICDECIAWIKSAKASKFYVRAGVILVLFDFVLMFNYSVGLLVPITIGSILSGCVLLKWIITSKRTNEIKPTKAFDIAPVTYYGWQGTVHTFRLSNENFAALFSNLNLKKIIA